MSNYSYKQIEGNYFIYDGENRLRTPGGNEVFTQYLPVAERIIRDLETFGYNFHSASSILAWHFTMIDNFARMEHSQIEMILAQSFLWREDWTCLDYDDKPWTALFGDWDERQIEIRQWLTDCTHMQLTAACCIGNAYESLNLSFVLASLMEKYEGEERQEAFQKLANLCARDFKNGPAAGIMKDFNTFDLYYGIHLAENGPILNNDIDFANNSEDTDGNGSIELSDLTGEEITVDVLTGRNFYHYTDYVVDAEQPNPYTFPDFELDLADSDDDEDSEDEDDEDEEAEEEEFAGLANYLPEDCWVKRFVDDEDINTRYLLYVTLDENGIVDDCDCLVERIQHMGGGGFFFMIPGMEMPTSKSYDYEYNPPEKVLNEIKMLRGKRILPSDFNFIGERLPQSLIDVLGNDGNYVEYNYALQSAYRSAYMHLSINTGEDGVIEDFCYSTYQSTGSAYGDMFSRPISYRDRKDEAIDMLLHILDEYTDEEYAAL